MKNLNPVLLAHYAGARTQLAEGVLCVRTDGAVFGFTSHDQSTVIEGITLQAAEGLKPSASHNTDDLAVNTMDVTVLLHVSTETEIAAGIWDNSVVTVFEYIWADPPTVLDDHVLIKRYGTLGDLHRQKGVLQAALKGLTQRLAVRTGRQYSPGCPWRLGSGECTVDLTPWTHTGSVTGVGSDPTREFMDSTSTQSDGYYNEGWLTLTSGVNAGLTREIRAWSSGQFSLYFPFFFPLQGGETYTAVHGDDKTKTTCKDVFNNYVNFGGFPDLPGIDKVWQNVTGM